MIDTVTHEKLAAQLAPNLALLAALSEMANITRAAELLDVPQPTLSRRLAALSDALGAPLTAPHGRGIRLTRAGEVLADAAADAMTRLESGIRRVLEEIEPASGHVVLGFLHLLGRSLVPSLIRDHRAAHPGTRFTLVQGSRQNMLDRLRDGELDLALLAPTPDDPAFESSVLTEQEIFLSVPSAHPLAPRDQVTIAELADEEFVLLEQGYGLRQITDALCAQAGFEPRIAFEGQESDTVRGLVAAGLGVALLPHFEPGAPAGVVEVPITPRASREIGLVWRAGESLPRAVAEFRDHAKAPKSLSGRPMPRK